MPLAAAAEPCFGPPESVVIKNAAEPLTLVLEDGRSVRLADIAPARWLTDAATAQTALVAAEGKAASLLPLAGEAKSDRYGRVMGEVVLKATGTSLRDALVADGLAFVNPTVMSEPCLTPLSVVERSAENKGKGLWAHGGVVRSADAPDLAADAGRFVMVRGRVLSVGETQRSVYLNFGEIYSTDFTALIAVKDAKGWPGGIAGVKAMAGEEVRIRGYLEAWNGGLIRVEHRAQIEALSFDAAPRGTPAASR